MIESSSENRDKIISREDHKNGIKIDLEHRDKDHLRRVTEDMGQDHSSSFETLWGSRNFKMTIFEIKAVEFLKLRIPDQPITLLHKYIAYPMFLQTNSNIFNSVLTQIKSDQSKIVKISQIDQNTINYFVEVQLQSSSHYTFCLISSPVVSFQNYLSKMDRF